MKYPKYIKITGIPNEPVGKVIDIGSHEHGMTWLRTEFPCPVRIDKRIFKKWRLGWPWDNHKEACEAEYLAFLVLNS